MKKDNFKEKRKALEVLASQGVLKCQKHDFYVERGMLHKRKCYITRRQEYNQCPYLTLDKRKETYEKT